MLHRFHRPKVFYHAYPQLAAVARCKHSVLLLSIINRAKGADWGHPFSSTSNFGAYCEILVWLLGTDGKRVMIQMFISCLRKLRGFLAECNKKNNEKNKIDIEMIPVLGFVFGKINWILKLFSFAYQQIKSWRHVQINFDVKLNLMLCQEYHLGIRCYQLREYLRDS